MPGLPDLLFPDIDREPEYYEARYPARGLPDGAMVTRLGPSPTGFIHLGNLYMAFANERLARQSGGVFFLRIEDTDDRREVEGAAQAVIGSLGHYGIGFDEGPLPGGETGAYGPYRQSLRGEIYRCFARKLLAEGKAYPCFLTEGEIGGIRARQEAAKLTPGIYGEWAVCRDLPPEEAARRVRGGEPWALRFRADGGAGGHVSVQDGIRGRLSMPKNAMDVVLLKANGMPTYHFAHVVDDRLMRATHVIRGEEWLSSLPIHIALFEALGWTPPTYCHTAVLMKLDGGAKRKLSKRKDPELSLDYYMSEGYHPAAMREYMLTIMNSNFEEWRLANPLSPIGEFGFSIEKMGNSGMLFDLDKLRDVSRERLLTIPARELAEFMADWAERAAPDAARLMRSDMGSLERMLDIGRGGEKPRKDLAYAAQILGHIGYFYDELFRIEDEWPESVPREDIAPLLLGYLEGYRHGDGRDDWFGRLRALAEENGYAAKPKDFRKSPRLYRGHVGDVSAVIRIALTGRRNSPDLWDIQQILGEARTRARIAAAAERAR
ncbi:MAG: glutamate--tRNA ligase [Clostridiales Family XIII bacterium]|jgi:glutamyl-tRNA synthetase|nr:glutamate--tRNA ligase [Clostridiales Family XIII bacterium]